MENEIWTGSVAATNESGVKTGCNVNKGDVINITATGTVTYNGVKETGPSDADGDQKSSTQEQGVQANAAALLVRIDQQTFIAGKSLSNWSVPVSGELVFLVNDKKGKYGDNKGTFQVTVTKAANTGPTDPGDTKPRPIPNLPANTQLTVTLINNEQWVRTATLNIDGEEAVLEVAGNKAISKAFTSKTGNVTISMVDSQHGAMRMPLNLVVLPVGATGKSMTFGAEKPNGEDLPAYMDVFIHIDWTTHITN
ncbi:hypothetical protein J1780_03565 [Rahnella aceris]|uniref:LecA/PA-IL family lectin n=1 Tax=Rahnella sp. (strain Y9602) TaxID=2703885 RepID=UPI001C2666AF|nr:LecA/PA-IL family lectin [Rahnella aceris]MBU9839033.1 hypothetical protein [Rahnella aceris]